MKPHILLVDDERSIRDPLSAYLQKNGYRVSSAADAATTRSPLGMPLMTEPVAHLVRRREPAPGSPAMNSDGTKLSRLLRCAAPDYI